jgi:hypothetical protein
MEETAAEYAAGLDAGDELWRRKLRKSRKILKRLERKFHFSARDKNPSPPLPPNVLFAT